MVNSFPEDQRIVITGRLASMSRTVAVAKIVQLGGMVRSVVNAWTDVLVIGADGWPMRSSGRLTRNLERAEALDQCGQRIEIISESEFLRRLTGEERATAIRHAHSIDLLSRLVGVSGLRLRRWVEQGLIRPVDINAAVHQFEYSEVIATKTLAKLIALGVSPVTLLRNLQRLQHWLPDDTAIADHLVRLQRELVIRDSSGRLIDAGGQLRFEFDDASSQMNSVALCESLLDSDALYDQAFACELEGRTDDAIANYRLWLDHFGSDDNVWFNLGNAYWLSELHAEAVDAYRCCLKTNENYVEAWNNLGLCLSQMDDRDNAIDALRKAFAIDPQSIDVCYNLADLLDETGRNSESRLLWLRIARSGIVSLITCYAKEQLARQSETSA